MRSPSSPRRSPTHVPEVGPRDEANDKVAERNRPDQVRREDDRDGKHRRAL
jgi:hypothetical protein